MALGTRYARGNTPRQWRSVDTQIMESLLKITPVNTNKMSTEEQHEYWKKLDTECKEKGLKTL